MRTSASHELKNKEVYNMATLGWIVVLIITIYIAVCFGKVAAKHGKNPILYGVLSIITPVNLIILGCWAFSDSDAQKRDQL
jgi:hypothetical protein